jgi:tripartite-type tricarboxylate transporter receptor subunit TctC
MDDMAEMTRRGLLVGSALALGSVRQAQAVGWPDQALNWIVPYPPGGSTDTFARPIAEYVIYRLGQSVVIDNRGGAGGTIGAALAARARPDGYTWLVGSTGHAYAPLIYPKAGFEMGRDFAPVSAFARVPAVLVINPARLDIRNLAEFIEIAKKKPGEISIASGGLGTINHLAIVLLESRAKIHLNHVPYRGAGPALQDLLAGQVDALFAAMSVIVPYANDGKLRVLGIAGRRSEFLLPGVPTMSDAGLPDFRVGSWDALFAPQGTPAPILDRMHDVVQEALADPKVKRVWEEQGAKVEFESRADFTHFVEREIARWSRIATAAHLRIE